jgi:DNA-directed RNA polymerase specialized sigma24 family protein
MRPDESVTEWIEHLKGGDGDAARHIWQRYHAGLVRLACQHLAGVRRAAADEEDVVLSAFHSFCQAVEAGRFPRLNDRDDLWRVLVCLTERKAIDLVRGQQRLKRGGASVEGESGLPGGADAGGLDALPSREPAPDFAAQVAEECQRLLELLGDDQLRAVALHKLEGYANEEIAARLGCALRTVERKLKLIRELWEAEVSR